MKSVAIIPLRAGSKGIPNKNKRKILGRPLYQWVLGEALKSDLDSIYVYTDDKEIMERVGSEYFWSKKVFAIERSVESASDIASTEMAMIELLDKHNIDCEIYTLLQATSPLTTREDINRVLNKIKLEGYDSALSVVETKRFFWDNNGNALNYDYLNRPRRQDFDGTLIENGAVYAARTDVFLQNSNRLGGKIGIVTMPEDTLVEIDEYSDWIILEKLIENRLNTMKNLPNKVKYLVLDVDGVFTDGTVAVSEEGELFKNFSLRDGMGLEILREGQVEPVVMTSEDSPIVRKRMEKLKIKHLFLGVKDKFSRLEQFCQENNIQRSEVAYIGDDINDQSNLASVGWSFCPYDAIDEVKRISDITLNNTGGDKAIRESVEFIVNYNKRFNR